MRLASTLEIFHQIEILFRGFNFLAFWFFGQKKFLKFYFKQWTVSIHSLSINSFEILWPFDSFRLLPNPIQILVEGFKFSSRSKFLFFYEKINLDLAHLDIYLPRHRHFGQNSYFGFHPALPIPILILC